MTRASTTKLNSPKVKILSGKEKKSSIAPIVAFNSANTIAAIAAPLKSLISTPLKKEAAASKATVLKTNLIKISCVEACNSACCISMFSVLLKIPIIWSGALFPDPFRITELLGLYFQSLNHQLLYSYLLPTEVNPPYLYLYYFFLQL